MKIRRLHNVLYTKMARSHRVFATFFIFAIGTFASVIYSQSPRIVVQTGCFTMIEEATYSPDGKILAINCRNEIKILEAASGREIRTIKAGTTGLQSLQFLADGKTIVAAWDRIRLWNIVTGEELTRSEDFAFTGQEIYGVRGSPDGKLIAIFGDGFHDAREDDGNIVNVWDVESRELVAEFLTKRSVRGVTFRDRKEILTISAEGFLDRWSVKTKKRIASVRVPLQQAKGEESPARSVIFSPDAKFVAVFNAAGAMQLFRTVDGGEVKIAAAAAPTSWRAATFTPTSKAFILAASDRVLFIDPINGRSLAEKKLSPRRGLSVFDISPDGAHALLDKEYSGGRLEFEDSALTSVRIDGDELEFVFSRLHQPVVDFKFSHDETMLLAPGGDVTGYRLKFLYLWKFGGDKVEVHQLTAEPVVEVECLFNPSDTRLAVKIYIHGADEPRSDGESNEIIRVWNTTSTEELPQIRLGQLKSDVIEFLDDEIIIAFNSKDRAAKLWSVTSGQEIANPRLVDTWLANHPVKADSPIYDADEQEKPTIMPRSGLEATLGDPGIALMKNGEIIVRLITLEGSYWVVAQPDGRFDTNKTLEVVKREKGDTEFAGLGIHWVFPDDPLKPQPLEIFMRQYYEPGLLARLLRCSSLKAGSVNRPCDEEFKPLPQLGSIGRVRPRIVSQANQLIGRQKKPR